MPFVHLTSFIAAPVRRVFDLSRHLSVHKQGMLKYDERIIGGKQGGLMELNEEVIWQAKHLLKNRRLKIRLTEIKPDAFFVDEQVEGDFNFFRHEHYFKPVENGTLLIDQLHFRSPYGWLGKAFDKIILEKYMKRLLLERNDYLKRVAESSQWKQYLNHE